MLLFPFLSRTDSPLPPSHDDPQPTVSFGEEAEQREEEEKLMASRRGSKDSENGAVRKMPSRKMTRLPTILLDVPEEEVPADSELVPSSLASIVPLLRVANEIEPLNARVAYLCRFRAFEVAHELDPTSSGRGVRQFKTYLLHRLQRDEEETKGMFAASDPREIQRFYQWYYENYVMEGPIERKPEEMAKHYQIASVLYDVLKSVVPKKVDDEIDRQAREVERKKAHFRPYNILPLRVSEGAAPAIMQLPEIKAAINELRKAEYLPMREVQSTSNAQQRVDASLIPGARDRSMLVKLTR